MSSMKVNSDKYKLLPSNNSYKVAPFPENTNDRYRDNQDVRARHGVSLKFNSDSNAIFVIAVLYMQFHVSLDHVITRLYCTWQSLYIGSSIKSCFLYGPGVYIHTELIKIVWLFLP